MNYYMIGGISQPVSVDNSTMNANFLYIQLLVIVRKAYQSTHFYSIMRLSKVK